MELRITAAGRVALADPANIGVAAVRVTKVLVGSGQGPGGVDDDARTALRNQRDSAVAGGSTTVPARVVVRGDVVATAAYNVTEVGLEAAIGGGQPFLFAYWTNAGQVFAAAAAGVTVVIVAAIDVVSETPAELTIDVDPAVQANFSSTFAGLTDTQAGALVASNYYRVNAAGVRLVAMTVAEVLADLFAGVASARYVRKQGGGFQSLTRGEVAQDLLAALGQEAYLRRAAGGGFEGLPRADVIEDLGGVDAGDLAVLGAGGLLAPARLGAGTPTHQKFLRGDGLWVRPNSVVETRHVSRSASTVQSDSDGEQTYLADTITVSGGNSLQVSYSLSIVATNNGPLDIVDMYLERGSARVHNGAPNQGNNYSWGNVPAGTYTFNVRVRITGGERSYRIGSGSMKHFRMQVRAISEPLERFRFEPYDWEDAKKGGTKIVLLPPRWRWRH